MNDILLEIDHLSKRYCRDPRRAAAYAMRDIWSDICGRAPGDALRPGEFWAVRDVNMQVARGEVVGLIGHNGAGKSTLINLVSGVLRPTLGSISLYTDLVVTMDHQSGLSPVQTGRENIGSQLSLHGMSALDIDAAIEAVVGYSELGEFADAPVGSYSLGMRARLAFAIYSQLKPDLFIVDEALSGGDLRFRNKFARFLKNHIDAGGSILMASHDIYTIQSMCDRCVVMDRGEAIISGTTPEALHAYTALAHERDRKSLEDKASAPTTDDRSCDELVRIESIEVIGADGDRIYPGDPVEIRIVCDSSETTEAVLCSVEIGSRGIFPVATHIGGFADSGYRMTPGRNEFLCRIDPFPLASGIYHLCVSVVTRDSGIVLGWKGYQDAGVIFEVHGHSDPQGNLMAYRNGIVHLSANWAQMVNHIGDTSLEERETEAQELSRNETVG
ncbi:ABC transporter ATP-binding protein [Capsulimonas corticalis]|uniref:ABC transporter ATP-binding protein n=1 Tax=Capsulimonas corticalis TaxID=2219043 RepID=A0A402D4D8_9BACT|nr:ABC transporter ATP-binding protein [Capsulimonas corticalis]BDI31149.1 ABC transporter ATP-binding protein [Capsulimonas corticalis]